MGIGQHDSEQRISPHRLVRRARRVTGVLLVAAIALLATHRGEFWPFSSFSMFASAGRPWQRAAVRVMSHAAWETPLQAAYSPDHLPGVPLALGQYDIPHNDLSSLVQRAERWNEEDVDVLSRLFGALPCQAPLLVLRVRGTLEAGVFEHGPSPLQGSAVKAGTFECRRCSRARRREVGARGASACRNG